jgi:hypothetical protein
MSPESLKVRVDRLENRVEILERLPDRVSGLESQIVLLRDEMRSEFSATRARDEETRRVLTERMDSTAAGLTERMDSRFEVLSQRMVSLFDENERHMRLLHEDMVQRIATLGEGRNR